MTKFIEVIIREKVEGKPGFIGQQEFNIFLDVDKITLFNKGEDPNVTFARLSCGATVCIVMGIKEFMKIIEDSSNANIRPLITNKKEKK